MRFSALLLILAACGPRLEEDTVNGLRRLQGVVGVGVDGKLKLKLRPEAGETSVLLTSRALDPVQRTHVLTVEQEKVVLFDAVDEAVSSYATTNAGYLSMAATLNWPRLSRDVLGERLDLTLGHVGVDDVYTRGDLEVTALFKKDSDLETGTLEVALVYAGGTDQDAALLDAMEQAESHWRALYASFGVELDVVAESVWPEGSLASPVFATEEAFATIADEVGPNVVPVVIAPTIDDIADVLGVAGDIPGPLAPTNRTAVLVSAIASAGVDGVFDDAEIQLLGETLAHECGHYLGLFHPVETSWSRWDALDDTVDCKGESACITRMSDHLMFPFPVCGFTSCTSQEVVTPDQAAVVHRYTGVR